MILIIKTIKRDKIELGLFDKNLHLFEFTTENQSDDILPAIKGILKKFKTSLKKIRAILVHKGPGSYTGVRVGMAVANTLAWSLDIPIFSYDDSNRKKILEKTLSTRKKFSQIVLPTYQDKIK